MTHTGSGWPIAEIAELRTMITAINANMVEVDRLITRTREAESLKMDLTPFYLSLREKIFALSADLDLIKDYLKKNRTTIAATQNPDYYDLEIQSLIAQVAGFNGFIVSPNAAPGIVDSKGKVHSGSMVPEDPSFEGTCTGIADGDTVWVTDESGAEHYLRLHGINAPEGGTERGKLAMAYITDLILDKKVRVNMDSRSKYDTYGRPLGVIMLHRDGQDDLNVNVDMVRSCNAVPLNKYGTYHWTDPDEIKQAFKGCLMGFPVVGRIKFYTAPSGAAIFVDGIDSGVKTPGEVEVPIGVHRFGLVAYGCSSVVDDIEVVADSVVPPVYHLPKIPAGVGTVIITPDQFDVLVTAYQDNAVVGDLPLIMDVLVDTPATMIFKAPGFMDLTQQIVSNLGTITRYTITLQKTT